MFYSQFHYLVEENLFLFIWTLDNGSWSLAFCNDPFESLESDEEIPKT